VGNNNKLAIADSNFALVAPPDELKETYASSGPFAPLYET